jgi:Alpha/beta hydrolase domain
MTLRIKRSLQYAALAVAILIDVVGWSSPSDAYVDKFVIDSTSTASYTPVGGVATSYTIYSGRIFGALDPDNPHNSIITDIKLAPTTNGKVNYIANFEIVTPTDSSQRTGLMIYQVPNRGGNAINTSSLLPGVTYVQSGWQGDLLTQCANVSPVPLYPCTDLNAGPYGTPRSGNTNPSGPQTAFVIQVPIATSNGKAPNGKNTITGQVYGHIKINTTGSTGQLVIFSSAYVPYQPAGYSPTSPSTTLNTAGAQFWSLTSQTTQGVDGPKTPITNWTWANCPSGPPGTPNPFFICLGSGTFDPNKLYEMVFKVQNPLVVGVGFAATRDLISFLRYSSVASGGGANPIASSVSKVMDVGSSQSGSFIRSSIFYGFNEEEGGGGKDAHETTGYFGKEDFGNKGHDNKGHEKRSRIIVDGAWPQIDGRLMWLNQRWAQPNVIPNLYMPGDEGPVWWADFPDESRHLPPNGLFHRCTTTDTCPEVLETFGSNEFYDEKMAPDMTGFCVVCRRDIPVPRTVYRYYLPGTSHGGSISANSFNWSAPPSTPVSSTQTYPSNPNGENFTNNALLSDFVDRLMTGRPMPISAPGFTYPTLAYRELVPPTKTAVGFPNIPGYSFGGDMAWPPFNFDFGPHVDYSQGTGIPTIQPPIIKQVLTEYVPRVNSDGNENVGSVPSVLHQAPLGTYSGWNIIPSGTFYAGQQVQLAGSFWPFQKTEADRAAAGDPRPSLEKRYGTHAGHVCVVTAAANKDVVRGFLLVADAQTLISFATASNVLGSPFTPTAADIDRANYLCSRPGAQALTATGRTH